jgi:hypothetical protein
VDRASAARKIDGMNAESVGRWIMQAKAGVVVLHNASNAHRDLGEKISKIEISN